MVRHVLYALILALAACSRSEPAPDVKARVVPATCARATFDAAMDELETLAFRRDEILARAESFRETGDVYADRLKLDQEMAHLEETTAQAAKVPVPRCLARAQEIFVRYMDDSQTQLRNRYPGASAGEYERIKETNAAVYGQFRAEVAQQRRNVQ